MWKSSSPTGRCLALLLTSLVLLTLSLTACTHTRNSAPPPELKQRREKARITAEEVRRTPRQSDRLRPLPQPVPAKPNLTLEEVDFAGQPHPAGPLADRPSSFFAKVTNNGSKPVTSPFITSLYFDGSLVQSWEWPSKGAIQDLGAGNVALNPGESFIYQYERSSVPVGFHTLRWVVDTNGTVDEQIETIQDNELNLNVKSHHPPDLTVQVLPKGSNGFKGLLTTQEHLTWYVLINNKGKGPAYGPFKVRVATSKSPQWRIFNITKGEVLYGGMTRTETFTESYVKDGVVKVTAEVDYLFTVPEEKGKENNNSFTHAYDIVGPDLTVGTIETLPKTPHAGEEFLLSFEVKNNGKADVIDQHNIVLHLTPAKHGVSRYSDYKVLAGNRMLNGTTSEKYQVRMKVPDKGEFDLQIILDASVMGPAGQGEQIHEEFEDNNLANYSLQVVEAPKQPTCTPGKAQITCRMRTSPPTGVADLRPYTCYIRLNSLERLETITNTSGMKASLSSDSTCDTSDYAGLKANGGIFPVSAPGLLQYKTFCLQGNNRGIDMGWPNAITMEYEWSCSD